MPSDPFYQSDAWRTLRRSFLQQHPTCQHPLCGKRAGHVDHVHPRRSHPHLELVEANLQALCHSHHSEKTVRNDGGFGRYLKMRGWKGADENGNPVDHTHPWNYGR
jgi:5-methylcytosine-specific restriction protein A